HYGLLSPAVKAQRLAAARAALAMPAANELAREDAAAFLKRVAGIDSSCCPHCRLGHWRTTAVLTPDRRVAVDGHTHCRGPP
nr:IS91 family transposase [Burkholderiaceae bacterium]